MSSGRKLIAALGAAIVVTALVATPAAAQPSLPGPAAADWPGPGELPRLRSELAAQARGGIAKVPQIRAKGTKKHKIYVEGYGGIVMIVTAKGPVFATYTTEGKGKPGHIRARFGRYGKVNMKFEKKGKVRTRKPKGCTGKADRIQRGVWKGTLEFKGDKQYTKVKRAKARGTQIKWGNYNCPPPSGPGPNLFLGADTEDTGDGTFTSFGASRNSTTNMRPYFFASHDEFVGKVIVYRSVDLRGDVSQFQYGFSPDVATVQPPKPFTGVGTYVDGDWSGNLKVKAAGKTIPLTGDHFTAWFGLF